MSRARFLYRGSLFLSAAAATSFLCNQKHSPDISTSQLVIQTVSPDQGTAAAAISKLREYVSTSTLRRCVPHLHYEAACKAFDDGAKFDFIADAAEIALPAVVSINVVQKSNFVFAVKGSGSGFIVDKRGYIITNEHVIEGNRTVTVVLGDGRELPGEVVAIDRTTDLALVKVDANFDLPVVRMGDASKLRPGQWCVAIGNSLQFPNTVTAGIVSNTSRNVADNDMLRLDRGQTQGKIGRTNYVQTDAAINPGSSGGPLVNLAGEVIAVNTMGVNAGASGIAFSIPVSEVKRFLDEFSKGGIEKGAKKGVKSNFSLGIQLVSLNPGMARFLHENGNLDDSVSQGVFVYDTARGSPARRAGLVRGDVIVKVGEVEVGSREDITRALQQTGEGVVVVTFYRPSRGFLGAEITPVRV